MKKCTILIPGSIFVILYLGFSDTKIVASKENTILAFQQPSSSSERIKSSASPTNPQFEEFAKTKEFEIEIELKNAQQTINNLQAMIKQQSSMLKEQSAMINQQQDIIQRQNKIIQDIQQRDIARAMSGYQQ